MLDVQYGAWNKASALMALIAETNRDQTKKRDPFQTHDFHPYAVKEKRKPDIVCKKGNWPSITNLMGGKNEVKRHRPN